MLRSRVRRSFTVEVKSKTRQSPSWPDNSSPSPVNWAALDPAPEAPSPFDTVWPDEVVRMPAAAAEKPRRILQSLIVAEPEPEPADPVIEREPRLPRVRRVKAPQTKTEIAASVGARPDAIWSFADIADASADLPIVPSPPPVQGRSEAVVTPVAVVRRVQAPRATEPTLAPGERWKRRLPRALR